MPRYCISTASCGGRPCHGLFKFLEGLALFNGRVWVANNGGDTPGRELVALRVENGDLVVDTVFGDQAQGTGAVVCPGGLFATSQHLWVNDQGFGKPDTTCGATDDRPRGRRRPAVHPDPARRPGDRPRPDRPLHRHHQPAGLRRPVRRGVVRGTTRAVLAAYAVLRHGQGGRSVGTLAASERGHGPRPGAALGAPFNPLALRTGHRRPTAPRPGRIAPRRLPCQSTPLGPPDGGPGRPGRGRPGGPPSATAQLPPGEIITTVICCLPNDQDGGLVRVNPLTGAQSILASGIIQPISVTLGPGDDLYVLTESSEVIRVSPAGDKERVGFVPTVPRAIVTGLLEWSPPLDHIVLASWSHYDVWQLDLGSRGVRVAQARLPLPRCEEARRTHRRQSEFRRDRACARARLRRDAASPRHRRRASDGSDSRPAAPHPALIAGRQLIPRRRAKRN